MKIILQLSSNTHFICSEIFLCRLSSCRLSVRQPHSLNIFSSETTGPIEARFHMESPWDGGTKLCSNGPGHMTKMADMAIYGKNLKKNLLLQNQKADDLETWYSA